nr:seed maturation protein SMP5 [Pinus tabuliformis]
MGSSSLFRLLTRSSVGRWKSTSFAQARAGIIGTATQDQRIFRREYIAGNPPSGTSTRIIIDAEFDDQSESRDLGMPAPEPATVGAVLEAVANNIPEKPVEQSDISAAQSAESRMMGQQVPGGPASTMQSAVDNSTVLDPPTIGETLADASERLATDKVVTQADARRVKIVESRNDPFGRLQEGGIGETMQDAADVNEARGFTGNA